MVEIQIEVKGAKAVCKMLAKAPGIITKHLKKAMTRSVEDVKRVAATYPPAPPGSSYARTLTLGRRWTTKVTATLGSVKGVCENLTPYGPLVMGETAQAAVHSLRWKTTAQIAKEKEKDVTAFFEAGIADAVKEIER